MVREINKEGLELIKSYEKCRLKAYKPTADDKWTIGWGDTNNVHEGMEITKQEADQRLGTRLSEVCTWVDKLVKVNISDNQFSALVSLAYNIGVGALSRSTLLKKLNNLDFFGAAQQFLLWDKQGGKVLEGLVRRRKDEKYLFSKNKNIDIS